MGWNLKTLTELLTAIINKTFIIKQEHMDKIQDKCNLLGWM